MAASAAISPFYFDHLLYESRVRHPARRLHVIHRRQKPPTGAVRVCHSIHDKKASDWESGRGDFVIH
jgi:hypothetical protein